MKTQNIAASKFLFDLKALLEKHKVYISSDEVFTALSDGDNIFTGMTYRFTSKNHNFSLDIEEVVESVKKK